jgi:hypothetical protein
MGKPAMTFRDIDPHVIIIIAALKVGGDHVLLCNGHDLSPGNRMRMIIHQV